jgi:hypothetical protein
VDIFAIALAIVALIVVVLLLASFIASIAIFFGPPDGFDVDLGYSPITKESEYESTEHKKTFRKKLR